MLVFTSVQIPSWGFVTTCLIVRLSPVFSFLEQTWFLVSYQNAFLCKCIIETKLKIFIKCWNNIGECLIPASLTLIVGFFFSSFMWLPLKMHYCCQISMLLTSLSNHCPPAKRQNAHQTIPVLMGCIVVQYRKQRPCPKQLTQYGFVVLRSLFAQARELIRLHLSLWEKCCHIWEDQNCERRLHWCPLYIFLQHYGDVKLGKRTISIMFC